jgi:hypothetical protein
MSNINLNNHYAAFKWAVSTNWKDKNGLYSAIRYKIHVLTNEYGLTEEEIAIDLFEEYWERGHYLTTKRLPHNWIAGLLLSQQPDPSRAKNLSPLDPRNSPDREDLDYLKSISSPKRPSFHSRPFQGDRLPHGRNGSGGSGRNVRVQSRRL